MESTAPPVDRARNVTTTQEAAAADQPSAPDVAGSRRILDAVPDATDFRDLLFNPTLIEVPPRLEREPYLDLGVPVLDQGKDGACTGFGLATVAHYLLRRRQVDRDEINVSPYMFYRMARRYDEWPGEAYSGSSARGAMKGWHKHGVCAEELWPQPDTDTDPMLNERRMTDAQRRVLGAYYRVNHKDLVAMHSALAEVGILYAMALIHEGWQQPNALHEIELRPRQLGGHAFAIVAYNEDGFWVQNSWGTGWANAGFAQLSYEDWLQNGRDIWVARLGVPIRVRPRQFIIAGTGPGHEATVQAQSRAMKTALTRAHVIRVAADGQLSQDGVYATTEQDVASIFELDFPGQTWDWSTRRLLLYAHGGLESERHAIQRISHYRNQWMPHQVFPLSFVWQTEFQTTIANLLHNALAQRCPDRDAAEAMEFVGDRLDDALEPLVRALGGRWHWAKLKQTGIDAALQDAGAIRIVLSYLEQLLADMPDLEIHLAAHSAGAIFLAPLVQLLTTTGRIHGGPMANLTGYGRRVASCTLWAPAITTTLFRQTYLPAIAAEQIERFTLFTLTDQAERKDDVAEIYGKSLLYLISNALEETHRIPLHRPYGEPLLGMQAFIANDEELNRLFASSRADWILAPNSDRTPGYASHSLEHAAFDQDGETVQSTLTRIVRLDGG